MIANLLGMLLVSGSVIARPSPALTSNTGAPTQSPVDDRTTQLTLTQALELARTQAPAVRRSAVRERLAEAGVVVHRPRLPNNPTINLAVGARLNRLGASTEVQAQLGQSLEIAGERALRLKAARARVRAQEAETRLARWHAEVAVREAFDLALVHQRQLSRAAQIFQSAQAMAETTEKLVASGQESEVRLELAQSDVARARADTIDAEYRYARARARLADVLGWSQEELPEPAGGLPSPTGRPRGDRMPSEAHPRLVTARRRVHAEHAQWLAARRDAWPHPVLGVYFASEREPGTAFRSYVGLVTLGMPLPFWRRNQGAIAEARAQWAAAQVEMSLQSSALAREQKATIGLVKSAADRVDVFENEVLPRLARTLEKYRRGYELGELGLMEVLEARDRLARLEAQTVEVWVKYIKARASYELASGHPWTDRGGLSASWQGPMAGDKTDPERVAFSVGAIGLN